MKFRKRHYCLFCTIRKAEVANKGNSSNGACKLTNHSIALQKKGSKYRLETRRFYRWSHSANLTHEGVILIWNFFLKGYSCIFKYHKLLSKLRASLSTCEETLHIISKKRLQEFWEEHPDAKSPLLAWYAIAKKANWQNLADTRMDFPHADQVGTCTVFNIHGNDYRLIAKVYYREQTILVRQVLTHPEYDRGRWKNDCNG